MRFTKAVLFSTIALSAACGRDYSNPQGPPPATNAAQVQIALPTAAAMVSAGEVRSAIAVVIDANGSFINAPAVVWTSSAPGVATVSGTGAIGTISAVDDGTTTITASSNGVQRAVSITVHRVMASVAIDNPAPVIGPGSTLQLSPKARDALGHDLPRITNFTYAVQGPNKIVVSPTGLVTALIATPVVRIIASAVQDGFTVSGMTTLSVFAPETFDYAAQLLGDNIQPTPVVTNGEGLTYFRLNGDRINALITWISLSGPATRLQLRGPATEAQNGNVLADLELVGQTQSFGILNGFLTAADILPQNGQPPISLTELITLMRAGRVYVNVITAQNPNGELRGQVVGPFR